MQYLGGKNRLRKKISSFLEFVRKEGQTYFEPFCGGAWVLQEMSGKRIASDGNTALITMYKELQNGWIPPENISEEEYKEIKKVRDVYDPITAFAGFGCSFGAKFFGGYARGIISNYCLNAKSSLEKQIKKMSDVDFIYGVYSDHDPVDMLVYCDPPYYGSTDYSFFKEKFDHEKFWETIRKWSKNNIVVVSEYTAPSDFVCVKSFDHFLRVRSKNGCEKKTEKLFMHESIAVTDSFI